MGKSLPTKRWRAGSKRGTDEYTLPSRPGDQSRTSGPCHPCLEPAKVALGKWRKAEERQAAAKTACCQETATGASTAATQPTVQHIRRRGCESPQECHLPAITSSLHPLSHHPIPTPNLPAIKTAADIKCLIVAPLQFGKAGGGVCKAKMKKKIFG